MKTKIKVPYGTFFITKLMNEYRFININLKCMQIQNINIYKK